MNIAALLETKLEKAADLEAVLKDQPADTKGLIEGMLKLLQAGADTIPADVLTKALEIAGVELPAAEPVEKFMGKDMGAGKVTCPKCGTSFEAKVAKELIEPIEKEAPVDPEVTRVLKEQTERYDKLEKEHQAEVRLRKSRDFSDAIRKELGAHLPDGALPGLFAASVGEPVEKADFESMHKALKGMVELIKDGAVMKQSMGTTSVNDGVSDAITSRMTELQKADPKMTETEARLKAYDEDPAAYAKMRDSWSKDGTNG